MPATIILALYDEDNRVVNYAVASQQISPASVVELEAGFRLPQNIAGHKLKAFVWDSWENMRPLYNAVEFK